MVATVVPLRRRLDWDDTLLPSTWLQKQGLSLAETSRRPDESEREVLRGVAKKVTRILSGAKRIGHVVVVTNAEKGWVELSCCRFLPEVYPLLEGVKVLSARSTFEPTCRLPVQWKKRAFRSEIDSFFKTWEGHATGRQVLSFGDSMAERTALIAATESLDCWAKSVKFLERPSPEQLTKQLEMLNQLLVALTEHEGSLDLCLRFESS